MPDFNLYISAEFTLTEHSPDCGVHAAVIELFVVQLSKKREQDLDASYRVYGTVDGVGYDGLHILWVTYGSLVQTEMCNKTCSLFFTGLLPPKFRLVFHCQ